MARCLTEAEARAIGGIGSATANLLCTYSRAQALGCKAASGVSLASNQIVYEGSIVTSHEYVDLGLPSGTKWAIYNIGASDYGYGNHFIWGDTTPVNVNTYTYVERTTTTYNDPATYYWGSSWKTPTEAQFVELDSNCTRSWRTGYNGYNGFLFTSKKNSRTIFFPAAGAVMARGSYRYQGQMCTYWSTTSSERSSYTSSSNKYARVLYGGTSEYYACSNFGKGYGCSVRAVLA